MFSTRTCQEFGLLEHRRFRDSPIISLTVIDMNLFTSIGGRQGCSQLELVRNLVYWNAHGSIKGRFAVKQLLISTYLPSK